MEVDFDPRELAFHTERMREENRLIGRFYDEHPHVDYEDILEGQDLADYEALLVPAREKWRREAAELTAQLDAEAAHAAAS